MRSLACLALLFSLAGCATPTALQRAVRNGDALGVASLLAAGTNVNEKGDWHDVGFAYGATALHVAAYFGRIDIARALIAHGADINARATLGGSPVHNAVNSGEADMVRFLLDKGAQTNFKNADGATPLHFAAAAGYAEIVRMLIDAGADPNPGTGTVPGALGMTPLQAAQKAGHTAVVRIFERIEEENRLEEEVRRKIRRSEIERRITKNMPLAHRQELSSEASAADPTPLAPALFPSFRDAQQKDSFAMIVGIGKYSTLPEARFAERDAEAFKNYMLALGIPRRNIIYLTGSNAGFTSLKKYLESWLPRNVKPSSRVYFYFSGHGAPDMATGEAYLVPWDGDPSFLKDTAYPIKRLYSNLDKLKAKDIIVALDACFSGAGGRSVLAEGVRPLITKVNLGKTPGGKVTVFSAAAGNEITSTLKNKGHGMFTYFFLKGLGGEAKNASGRITAKSLYNYIKPRVQDEARRQNREQTPFYHSAANIIIRDR